MKIVRAADLPNPEEMIDQGYQVYQEVVATLPKPFPVIILPRLRDAFNKQETLLAIDEQTNKVVGIALVEKLHDLQDSVGRFGQAAIDYVEQNLAGDKGAPVYELGGIAVSPAARQGGLGAAFYKAAAKVSNGRCVAVVTEANVAGQKTAIKADFEQIPGAVFNAPFTVKDGRAVPDAKGEHRVKAIIYGMPANSNALRP